MGKLSDCEMCECYVSESKIYTAYEIADILGWARSTVRVYIMQGRIKATKHGRDWKITQAEVDRLLSNQRDRMI